MFTLRSVLSLVALTLTAACDLPVGADLTFELDSRIAPPTRTSLITEGGKPARPMILVVDTEELGWAETRPHHHHTHAKVVCSVEDLWIRWGQNGCPPELAVEARLYLAEGDVSCGDFLYDEDAQPTTRLLAVSDRHVLWEGAGVPEPTYRCPDVDLALEVVIPLNAI